MKQSYGNKIIKQFKLRSSSFDQSANWITSDVLIKSHLALAGKPSGKALEICCGTGQIGRHLKGVGWDVVGIDICDEMVLVTSKYFNVYKTNAENLPFKDNSFSLVVCRQAMQFLDVELVCAEVRRVLCEGGIFVTSLTVPFSNDDEDWLRKIHEIKQPLLKRFFSAETLKVAITKAGFSLEQEIHVKIEESINRWMDFAPELSREVKERIIDMVRHAPETYRLVRGVRESGKEVFENWRWVIISLS